MQPLSAIVAYDRNRVIGAAGDLPWHHPADLKHFKQTTLGHAVIHGRKSYEALGKPLPKRVNIVITRQAGYSAPGCEVVADVPSAIEAARKHDPEPFILGGGEIYRLAMPWTTRLYLTEIDEAHDGDTTFPEIDEAEWRETERRVDGVLTFRTLERIA